MCEIILPDIRMNRVNEIFQPESIVHYIYISFVCTYNEITERVQKVQNNEYIIYSRVQYSNILVFIYWNTFLVYDKTG